MMRAKHQPAAEAFGTSATSACGHDVVIAGKYHVERVLGMGGGGVVVAARHRHLNKRVAIKYLLPHALAMPSSVERFHREARIAARMQGDHAVQVIDMGKLENGAPFLVMEYLEGCDLDEYLATRGRLPIHEAVSYVLQACVALAEAHAARIVHRDLKPSNLFLAERPDGRRIIKLLDFGISERLGPEGVKTPGVLGTLRYIAPEQIRPTSDVDVRTDIWALGVTLYELLTDVAPFGGETAFESIALIILNAPKPIRELRPEIPEELALIIARCLETDVERRFQTVGELASSLARVASGRLCDLDVESMLSSIACTSYETLPPISDETPTESTTRCSEVRRVESPVQKTTLVSETDLLIQSNEPSRARSRRR
jgi:serine/threonine protein kinase